MSSCQSPANRQILQLFFPFFLPCCCWNLKWQKKAAENRLCMKHAPSRRHTKKKRNICKGLNSNLSKHFFFSLCIHGYSAWRTFLWRCKCGPSIIKFPTRASPPLKGSTYERGNESSDKACNFHSIIVIATIRRHRWKHRQCNLFVRGSTPCY